jgi:hypothetical protein
MWSVADNKNNEIIYKQFIQTYKLDGKKNMLMLITPCNQCLNVCFHAPRLTIKTRGKNVVYKPILYHLNAQKTNP